MVKSARTLTLERVAPQERVGALEVPRPLAEVSDWKRFRQAYLEAHQRFLKYEGVIGVGYGPQRTKGEETGQLSIVVLVRQKLPIDRIPDRHVVPRTYKGFPVDVREPHVDHVDHPERIPVRGHEDLFMIDWAKVHRMHLEELSKVAPAAPPATATVGQVFVIEDNGTLVTGAAGFSSVDWPLAYQYFLDTWGDDYDFVAMYVDTASGMPNPGASYGDTIYNDVVGVNHFRGDSYNNRSAYGTTRLQGLEVMLPGTSRYVRLQEIGHRWGSYVRFKNSATDPVDHDDLLRPDHYHWALKFDDDKSSMDYDGVDWIFNADGTFTRSPLGSNEYAYCPLDLYLMGMYAPAEVLTFYYIDNLMATPTDPNRFTGTPVPLMLQNVAWAHGWRSPTASNSPRSFRQAFVVLTKTLSAGTTLAATVDTDRIAHMEAFRESNQSRSVLDTYLYTDAYEGVYIKDNDTDIGIEPSGGVFWDSPDIWVRNTDDNAAAHQDTIRGQDNFVRVRVRNNGPEASGEITVNIFRANFVGTEFVYPDDWRFGERIGSQTIPTVPASGEVIAKFTWNAAMIPPAVGWHPCLLAEVLPIHRTQTLLRGVTQDRRLAQKNISIVDPPPGTRSLSFPFQIGASSVPARFVRLRVQQTEGMTIGKLAIDLGKENWLGRLGKLITTGETLGSWIASSGPAAEEEYVRVRFLSSAKLSIALSAVGTAEATVELPEGTRVGLTTARFARLSMLTHGGMIVEEEGRPHFLIQSPSEGGDIALPLYEAERQELTLRLDLLESAPAGDARFEIAQLDEQGKAVGGASLIVRTGAHGTVH